MYVYNLSPLARSIPLCSPRPLEVMLVVAAAQLTNSTRTVAKYPSSKQKSAKSENDNGSSAYNHSNSAALQCLLPHSSRMLLPPSRRPSCPSLRPPEPGQVGHLPICRRRRWRRTVRDQDQISRKRPVVVYGLRYLDRPRGRRQMSVCLRPWPVRTSDRTRTVM